MEGAKGICKSVVCCSVLHICCVLQCVAECCSAVLRGRKAFAAVWDLLGVAVCCIFNCFVAVCCMICCPSLECVAVCYSAL